MDKITCSKWERVDIDENDVGVDIETLKKYNLVYSDGSPMQPAFIDSAVVWATAATPEDPVYAIFNGGTNRLVILKYEKGDWSEVNFEDISCGDLYNLMWKWATFHSHGKKMNFYMREIDITGDMMHDYIMAKDVTKEYQSRCNDGYIKTE